jgi:hypothetical protein
MKFNCLSSSWVLILEIVAFLWVFHGQYHNYCLKFDAGSMKLKHDHDRNSSYSKNIITITPLRNWIHG